MSVWDCTKRSFSEKSPYQFSLFLSFIFDCFTYFPVLSISFSVFLNGRVLILSFYLCVTLEFFFNLNSLSFIEMLLLLPINIATFLFPTKRDNNIINWFG